MNQVLTFSSSLVKDSITLTRQGSIVGKLFKTSWMGWPVTFIVGDTEYKCAKKGLIQPQIIITDKRNNRTITTIQIKYPWLGYCLKGITTLPDNRKLEWRKPVFFNGNWQWMENKKIFIYSTEAARPFCLMGKITITDDREYNELLGMLGLLLRISIAKRHIAGFIVGFSLIFLNIPRVFL